MVRISRSEIRSEKVLERRRKRQYKIFAVIFVLVVTLLAVVVWFFKNKNFMIRSIEISRTVVIDPDTIKAEIEKTLNENYVFIFPKRHIFLYPKEKLENTVLEKFSWVKNIEITLTKERILSILVTEQTPTYLWCKQQNLIPEITDETLASLCYFADDRGYLFAQAPYFSDIVYVKIFGGQPGTLEHPSRTFILDEVDWKSIIDARSLLEKANIKTHTITILENGNISFKLLHLGELRVPVSAEIRLSQSFSLQTQIENIFTAIKEQAFLDSYGRYDGKLEYIDARIENSIYYRFVGAK